MSLLRSSVPLRRSLISARPSALMTIRGYADDPNKGEFSEQHQRGNLSGFQKKEQAQENQYFKEQEQEKLKLLRQKLAAQRKSLDELESAVNDMEKK